MNISTNIKSIQDIMRKDTGIDGDAQRISQMGWMLFLKIYDDSELERELLDKDYKSLVPDHLKWRNWASDDEGITGDELVEFVNNDLFPALKDLSAPADSKARGLSVREVFADMFNYMKSGQLLRQVINKINEIDFNDLKQRQHFGDIYEKILNDLQSAGNSGEYYTPRAVTQFMVDMVDPKLGETLIDPACGTGGFLANSIDHIRSKYVKSTADEKKLQASLQGVEKKPLPYVLCVTNMLLHNIERPTWVRHDNTLSRPLRDYGAKDRVDVVITNPPFGGMEEDGIEANFPKAFQTRETADLFLVLIMTLLRDGGRAAVVLPDGSLFGEGVKTRIKEKLLTDCNLHTIVRLPSSVFSPYASIGTNLLFFTKGEPTEEIWYYQHNVIESQKAYSKTKPIKREYLDPIADWWTKREESENAWKVSIKEIEERDFNLDIKNPNEKGAQIGDPVALLSELQDSEKDAAQLRGQLKDILTQALTQ